ncbi:MAG: carboxypeptidase-like regulatory domain-containing protein [Alphaproteobacteria bacterium]
MKFFFFGLQILLFCLCSFVCAQHCYAKTEDANDSRLYEEEADAYQKRLSLARDFVTKLKAGLNRAQQQIDPAGAEEQGGSGVLVQNVLPEGEFLFLQPVLEDRFSPEGFIGAEIFGGRPVLSLRDFAEVLQLAIEINPDGAGASGWYIREDRPFSLDMAQREVSTSEGVFRVSDDVLAKDGDIFVPYEELARWLGMDVDMRVASQEITLKADVMLPIQEKEERKGKTYKRFAVPDPSLPLGGEPYTTGSPPVIEVSTNSRYDKRTGDVEGDYSHRANVRTANDFMKGTFKTSSQIDNRNQLTRMQASYERDSLEGDLLGDLEARYLGIGDIITTRLPGGTSSRELGVRVTNADPVRNFRRARTSISGTAIPGWDVELYRNEQFLELLTVGDDGFYSFDDVTLFTSDNNFRLVFHGPQGERHEEAVYVPYDREVLSRGEGIYDVSVSFDGQQAYVKRDLKSSDDDRGTMNFAALYERPLFDGVVGSFGVRSGENDGVRDYVGSAGFSWIYKQALMNFDLGIDDEGESAAEFSVRRDFGEHQFNYSNEWRQAYFDDGSASSDDNSMFENRLSIGGPFIKPYGFTSSHYGAGLVYSIEDNEKPRLSSDLNWNLGHPYASLGGQLQYNTGGTLEDDRLSSRVNINTKRGKSRLRLVSDYEILPQARVERLSASFTRDLNHDLDIDLSVSKDQNRELVEYQARLDWQAGFIRISPSVSYNTNDDFFAGLNTRFGLVQEPFSREIKMLDRPLSSNAFLSAFVYLDKNGDGEFNGEDEPLPDVIVRAPQNGVRNVTNEKGVAFFDRMLDLRLTDVFLDPETLQDPAWIPGFEGVSILPRQGYVAEVEFPVHMSGELDGTVYARVFPDPSEGDHDDEKAGIEPESGERAVEAQSTQALSEEDVPEDASGDLEAGEAALEAVIADLEPELVPMRGVELLLYNDQGEVEQRIRTEFDGFYYFSNIPPGRYLLMMSERSARARDLIRPKPQLIEISYDGTVIYDYEIIVNVGSDDVPSEVLADLGPYKERHPDVDFDETTDFSLNLGEYNSQLMMSLVWYKLRSHYLGILGDDTFPMVSPADSYADVETGKHTLRVELKDRTLEQAYAICQVLMARDQYCKVEIFPSYMDEVQMKQARASAVQKVN